jgi:hypothetical protein
MYKDFFILSPLLSHPLVSLVLFMVVFATVLFHALHRPAKHFESDARLPLGTDQENRREH